MTLLREPIPPPTDIHRLVAKNTTDAIVAYLGDAGNVVLRGACSSQATCTAPENSLIFRNTTDTTTAYIDSNDNMCLEGSSCSAQASTCTPTVPALSIRNATDHNKVIIKAFTGQVIYGSSTRNITTPHDYEKIYCHSTGWSVIL